MRDGDEGLFVIAKSLCDEAMATLSASNSLEQHRRPWIASLRSQ